MSAQDQDATFAKAWDEFLALREKAWSSNDQNVALAAGKAFGRLMAAAAALGEPAPTMGANVVRFPSPRPQTPPKGGSAA